jgi:hypothetical protein
MEPKTTITELKARLARAESERDTWRAAGRQEHYLEAYSMVEALALQLEELERTARPSVSTASPAASPDKQARDAAAFGITYNGRSYGYGGYHYDRFAQAVHYARLDRTRAFAYPGAQDAAPLEGVPRPSGVFHWVKYRYDRLADVIASARRGEIS